MGYEIVFGVTEDDEKHAKIAVKELNEACRNMKEKWLAGIKTYRKSGVAKEADTLFDFLLDFLEDDAEIFFFESQVKNVKNMARRLCAALRLVSEAVYETDGLDETLYECASLLKKATNWSAHPHNSGERSQREKPQHNYYRFDIINIDKIRDITKMVKELCENVTRQLSSHHSSSTITMIPCSDMNAQKVQWRQQVYDYLLTVLQSPEVGVLVSLICIKVPRGSISKPLQVLREDSRFEIPQKQVIGEEKIFLKRSADNTSANLVAQMQSDTKANNANEVLRVLESMQKNTRVELSNWDWERTFCCFRNNSVSQASELAVLAHETIMMENREAASCLAEVVKIICRKDIGREACINADVVSALIHLARTKIAKENSDVAGNIASALHSISISNEGLKACLNFEAPSVLTALMRIAAVTKDRKTVWRLAEALKIFASSSRGRQECIDCDAPESLFALDRDTDEAARSVTEAFYAITGQCITEYTPPGMHDYTKDYTQFVHNCTAEFTKYVVQERTESNFTFVAHKPIIYLYPIEPLPSVSVSVSLFRQEARFTGLLPSPSVKSSRNVTWNVSAQPDGTLRTLGDFSVKPPVTSLFWEAEGYGGASLLPENATDTFGVKGEDAGEWLLQALACWGLTPREYTECASFWLPIMARHAWVEIRRVSDSEWEALTKLESVPPMSNKLRVFLAWRGLSSKPDTKGVLPPIPPPRVGSWIVEWGGSELP